MIMVTLYRLFQRLILAINIKLKYNCPIKNKQGARKIFVSYITRPFRDKRAVYASSHQNVNEILKLYYVLDSLNYCIDWYNLDSNIECTNTYDVVFGLEPNFVKACIANPNALKIYYATGAYYKHQNQQIINRTNYFNSKYGVKIPYRRLIVPHLACEIADIILQIGTQETIQTYPAHLRDKVVLLDQSSHDFLAIDIKKKQSISRRDCFVWFGSSGAILKGLDLILDYFIENCTETIHLFGVVEQDVLDAYEIKIKGCRNIFIHGFVDINSIFFREIMDQCGFLIFPSSSEGCPGSVINAMKLGVIPIATKWAAPDNILELGYLLPELSTEAIAESIKWTKSLNDSEFIQLIERCHSFVKTKYSIDIFETQLYSFFNKPVGVSIKK